ncbi:hypothetical protein EVAR_101058_1 [Eumeta japonica]|uniref:Uncharacterized protein n=1 Tax=Eumeta variegata TaxID=151549 RepID=A0A4C1SHW7_EUMVA|nr:hypothetical protein EVAR_101058_1 [Eumeta japonica]
MREGLSCDKNLMQETEFHMGEAAEGNVSSAQDPSTVIRNVFTRASPERFPKKTLYFSALRHRGHNAAVDGFGFRHQPLHIPLTSGMVTTLAEGERNKSCQEKEPDGDASLS